MDTSPVIVQPMIYILELENDKYYVGITTNMNYRWGQHKQGMGSNWTRLHRPIRIQEVICDSNKHMENDKTLQMMKKYGWENVRGGNWCTVDLKAPPQGLETK
jgi:predicted GIY-YIG superfamily endonuclease|tara:strand:- start:664 stop:972 length:309 start_codon:yes stop_codon:yes gene_type:complete